jgi:hypothetical protein
LLPVVVEAAFRDERLEKAATEVEDSKTFV